MKTPKKKLSKNIGERFWRLTPPRFLPFCKLLVTHGFYPVVIGGFVRELLLSEATDHLETDLDVEIYASASVAQEGDGHGWSAAWEKCLGALKLAGFAIESKSEILKVYAIENFEMSLPRRESYPHQHQPTAALSHTDFIAQISPILSYQEAFARRDLTVNALGLEILLRDLEGEAELSLIDLWGGEHHLEQKFLVPCQREVFVKDPVRLLRALRMHFLPSGPFQFSRELQEQWRHFNLEKLSPYYFFEEGFRSFQIYDFLKVFFKLVEREKIPLPVFIEEFHNEIYLHLSPDSRVKNSFSFVLIWIDWNLQAKLSREQLKKWVTRLEYPLKKAMNILSLVSLLKKRDWEGLFWQWSKIRDSSEVGEANLAIAVEFFHLQRELDFIKQLLSFSREFFPPDWKKMNADDKTGEREEMNKFKKHYFRELLEHAAQRGICPFDQGAN